MLKNLKIFHKLAISYFLIGALTVIVISVIFYSSFKQALIERTSAQLSSINILKKSQIENYFIYQKSNIDFISRDSIILKLISTYGNNRDKVDRVIRTHHEYLKKLFESHHYREFSIMNDHNEAIFSSNKFKVFDSLNISSPGNERLSAFYNKSITRFTLLDATDIFNSYKALVIIGNPIILNNEKKGFIIVQTEFNELEKILFERTGMGKTGESYLVGPDYRMRSRSRFYPEKSPNTILVKTIATQGIYSGKHAKTVNIIEDYRKVQVLSYYRKIDSKDLNWMILSEMDFEEALTPVYTIRNYIIVTGTILIILILLVTVILSKKISGPIVQLKGIILMLSKGIFPKEVEPDSKDEIGEMTVAIDILIQGFKRTRDFAHEIGNGNFKIEFSPLSDQDILGASLLQMRDSLKELKRKEAALMREKSSALLEGQEKERRRISRELHDGIGQLLTVIRFKIAGIENEEEFKRESKQLLDETITEVRRISNNVMPSVLLDFGLDAGLKNLCNNTSKYTGVKVFYNYIKDSDSEINFEISVSLYRIAQEALNNIVKYASATLANVTIIHSDENIYLEISDDGKGFNLEDYGSTGKFSNGLKNMEERVNILEGKFNITSEINQGTIISVEIPIVQTS